ncbi:amino acid adenylation domain protein (plasmid) [Gloeothece citriformis PCC 7424]|uniref:Amino acid adenylation domain protein n=1 Tax=Gloeothece citriformis (strain PCC 7424) TaxID=65393 RepID=B7KM98_GLOC7|nr:non-ribosomal peptide synthetase [Gloeothece citriformis]ACK73920.1 amino acid adenylation domain protein [Gloeothece citriformis PCC 7424]
MNNIEDLYELSPMQQGMLFHSLYSPESEVYFEQLICILKGKLNLSAFQKAWEKIVDRHPVLRSSFYWEEIEKPLQMVNRQIELSWNIYDWQNWDQGQQQSQLETFLKQDRAKGIALDEAPLMRFTLIQLDRDIYQFIWSHHHILFDGWSMQIILQEVFDLYEAYQKGKFLTLKPCYPYRDYIQWLQQQDNSKAQKFWQNQLQGFEAETPIEIDKLPGQKTSQVAYHQIPFKFPLEISQKLESLAQKNRLTLNNIVQGAWGLLLSRYSGESDVIFGATVSVRPSNLPDVDKRVGLFINTLPIRLKISDQMALIPWLKQLQSQQIEQEQYAYYSLADIQKNSDILSGKPLFESLLVFENYPQDSAEKETNKTLKITNINCFERTNYPITIVVNPDSELSGRIIYDSSRFASEPIELMIGHFQNLLTEFALKPEQFLCKFSLLTQAEEKELISAEQKNQAQIKNINYQCIHHLFEQQVIKTPDAIALIYKNQKLTYKELNTHANQLAHYLQYLGVKLEDKIGVCIERSPLMIIAILAILKVGGAYVPLDPGYPSERLAFMIKDAQSPIILTQKHLLTQLFQDDHQLLIDIESEWDSIAQYSSDNLTCEVSLENLAYIIYTSGSTGTPKGTEIPHRSFLGFMFGVDYIQLDANVIWLQHSSISWDAAILELWPPLLYGGCCVLYPGNIVTPEKLSKIIQNEKINTLWLTAALFNLMIDTQPESLLGIKQLLVGGESLSVNYISQALELLPETKIINGYGPSECTVFTCCYPIDRKLDKKITSIPIGQPIGDRIVYLLDRNLHRVPVGVPGEIYIGGASVARGYLNQPILTQENFIPNPFIPGDILYRTGDIGRRLPNGNLEFVGRINNQIKIRGFRIELEEIETVLGKHSGIKQAVVTLGKNSLGEKSLVAYIMAKNSQLTPQTVRDFLREKLPDYMIPNAFVFLDAFPLNPNGKINRRNLPDPDTQQRQTWVEFVEPRTEIEQQIAAIWLKILGLNQVGIYDNFFELGGHSLLVTQVISRLKETFEIEFSFRYFFDNPTITQLAEQVIIQQLEQSEVDELEQILEEIDQLSEEEVVEQLFI